VSHDPSEITLKWGFGAQVSYYQCVKQWAAVLIVFSGFFDEKKEERTVFV